MQKRVRGSTLLRYIQIAMFCILATGCSAFRFPGVFKIDIAQGNIVSQEALDQLKPGMSRRQVLFVMGSPMLTDTFNNNRWDYYLSYQNGAEAPEKRHITLYFDNYKYTHYTGDIGEPLSFEKLNNLNNKGKEKEKKGKEAAQ